MDGGIPVEAESEVAYVGDETDGRQAQAAARQLKHPLERLTHGRRRRGCRTLPPEPLKEESPRFVEVAQLVGVHADIVPQAFQVSRPAQAAQPIPSAFRLTSASLASEE